MANLDELERNTGFTTAVKGKVTFLPELPRNATGKVLKRELAAA